MHKDESHFKETLKIIETLAEGVNPVTGEILPDQSPYNEPLVIRALFTVTQLLRQQQSHSEKPLPARAGNSWDAEEDRAIIEEFHTNLPMWVMAEKHLRTRGAIQARLVRLGLIEPSTGQPMADKTTPAPTQTWKEQGRTQVGKPWTREEDAQLVREFQAGVSLEDLAEKLKRGVNAVEVRLVKLKIQLGMP